MQVTRIHYEVMCVKNGRRAGIPQPFDLLREAVEHGQKIAERMNTPFIEFTGRERLVDLDPETSAVVLDVIVKRSGPDGQYRRVYEVPPQTLKFPFDPTTRSPPNPPQIFVKPSPTG